MSGGTSLCEGEWRHVGALCSSDALSWGPESPGGLSCSSDTWSWEPPEAVELTGGLSSLDLRIGVGSLLRLRES